MNFLEATHRHVLLAFWPITPAQNIEQPFVSDILYESMFSTSRIPIGYNRKWRCLPVVHNNKYIFVWRKKNTWHFSSGLSANRLSPCIATIKCSSFRTSRSNIGFLSFSLTMCKNYKKLKHFSHNADTRTVHTKTEITIITVFLKLNYWQSFFRTH